MLYRSASAVLALVSLAVPSFAQDDSGLLRLRTETFDPTVSTPFVPAALRGGEDTHLWVVQFDGLPTESMRRAVRAQGAQIHSYLPDNSYVVRMGQQAADSVRSLGAVRHVGSYHPAWRLEPELVAQIASGAQGTVRVNILLVDESTDKPVLGQSIQALGGTVVDERDISVLMVADLTMAQLTKAARLDQVLYIDRWSPVEFDMNNGRIQGGGVYVETQGNFRGQGVMGHVYEGVEETHPDFTNQPGSYQSSPTADRHGHCTAGIVFGNGTSHPNARGMAPDGTFMYTNIGSSSASRLSVYQGLRSFNVMFSTASWGNARTTEYTTLSADTDDAIFRTDMPALQSQSNAGNRQSRPQAWAKNIISIGGVGHLDDSSPSNDRWSQGGASTGLATDGRIKPDLCAYYDSIWTSDLTGGAGYSNQDHTTGFGGTSGATPMVAGHTAIALQMFTDAIFGNKLRQIGGTRFQNTPHFPTIKALMIATARQYTILSNDNRREHQGWGFPDLRKMYDSKDAMFIVDEEDILTQGQTSSYQIAVNPNTPELKICMSFADPRGNPAGSQMAVNNLSLKVTDPSGTVYWGNQGLDRGNRSTPGGTENNIDTVECVIVTTPAAGNWNVEVIATRIVQDGHVQTPGVDADYGLVVVGGKEPGGGGGGLCEKRYIPDSLANTGTCNDIPFGTNAGSSLENQKYQTIIRANELGGAAQSFNALSFAPCGTGTRQHTWLTIKMSHVPAGHTLSATFANNLPNPVTVLVQNQYRWNQVAGQWSSVGLTRRFDYDGTSDVVLEITARGSNFSTTSGTGFRRGSRERVYATGFNGAPPASGILSPFGALKMELAWKCAKASVHGIGCNGFEVGYAGDPALNGNFTVSASNSRPNTSVFFNFGLINFGIYPFDLTAAGLPGCWLWHDALVSFATMANGTGDASFAFPIPNIPAVAGANLYSQAIQLDPSVTGGVKTSNYIRMLLGE